MPRDIHWDGVWLSVVDTWLPLLAVIIGLAVICIVWRYIRKRRRLR